MILHTKFKMMSNLYNEWLTLSATFHEVLTLYKVSKKDEFFIWNRTYCMHKVRARLTKDINVAWGYIIKRDLEDEDKHRARKSDLCFIPYMAIRDNRP